MKLILNYGQLLSVLYDWPKTLFETQPQKFMPRRLAVLELSENEDEDMFANDSKCKALYQTLADINQELGVMYTDMS